MNHQIDIDTNTNNEIYSIGHSFDEANIILKTANLSVAKKTAFEIGEGVKVYDHLGRIVYEPKKKRNYNSVAFKRVTNWDKGTKVSCLAINYYSVATNTIPDGAYTGTIEINKSFLTYDKIEVKLLDLEGLIVYCKADDIKKLLI